MPNETALRNSIKIFSSKYMADLSYDTDSSYVLNFSFVTSFASELKKVFEKDSPVMLREPVEEITGYFTIIPKGLKSVLACICRSDASAFPAAAPEEFCEFHIVANCYDPASANNFVGYYASFCRVSSVPYTDLSDITQPVKFAFAAGGLNTAMGAFDALGATGTNSANQEIPFTYTPVLYQGSYAQNVFKDDTLLTKDTDYSQDSSKVTILGAVPTTSKITVVYIYNP